MLAILRGGHNGRTVLLRGDMDALPLTEDTGLEFSLKTQGAPVRSRSWRSCSTQLGSRKMQLIAERTRKSPEARSATARSFAALCADAAAPRR